MLSGVHDSKNTANWPHKSTVNLLPSVPRSERLYCRTVEDIDIQGFAKRLEERLEALQMSPRAASLAASNSPDLIRNILRGHAKSVRGDHLVGLARVLETTESWLMTGMSSTDIAPEERSIRYGGIIEAGAFRPANIFDQEGEHRTVPLPPDPRYPVAAQFAFEVSGDSMDRARMFPGMWVQAIEAHVWERLHGEPRDGQLVIVARERAGDAARDGDGERELTVKRLRIFRDRMELHPESSNPVHQPLIFLRHAEDQPLTARIIAVVVSAHWIYG